MIYLLHLCHHVQINSEIVIRPGIKIARFEREDYYRQKFFCKRKGVKGGSIFSCGCLMHSGCTRDTRVAEAPPSGNSCSPLRPRTRAMSVSGPKINFTHRTTLRSTCRRDTQMSRSLLRFLSYRKPSRRFKETLSIEKISFR